MALAQETEVLLLDEPTTFLDLAHQVEVLDLLRRPQRHRAAAPIVMVLHDLNQAARYADHLVAMRDGRVVGRGPARRRRHRGDGREVFGLDCAVVACPVSGRPLVVPRGTSRLPVPTAVLTALDPT